MECDEQALAVVSNAAMPVLLFFPENQIIHPF